MNIITVRRISQIFFAALFVWFCVVATLGEKFWQWRGWPVNWFLQLDPLVALGTALTTRTLYAGLAWAGLTIALTIVLGRFFCGWVCPFGSLHQLVGWLGRRTLKFAQRLSMNQYRPAARIKYYILFGMLGAAVLGAGSLQTGWLDPIPLIHRSVNLALLPLADGAGRHYEGAWLIGAVFLTAVLLNLVVPRFYCRFVCPLGALFGLLTRWTLWRVGKVTGECTGCELCQNDCEGACEPFEKIRSAECLLCMNCLHACRQAQMTYSTSRSAAGEVASPDISRRGFILSAATGLAAAPMFRLGGLTGSNWNPSLIRPPGAVEEADFLDRCIKCGQCMRVCPTNIIQPAGLQAGLEGVWSPVLNFRIGTSGCQLNCVACGHICPTAAIRRLALDEKLGRGRFSDAGPIRMGLAFVDRGRCLPWAMDKPCIVCQENCPVSPKAIFLREEFQTVRDGVLRVARMEGDTIYFAGGSLPAGRLGTGDYFCKAGDRSRRIIASTDNSVTLDSEITSAGDLVEIQVRLQKPFVDPKLCTGCGICEHECPVSGLRAIRVTAENETRSRKHSLTL
jgi:polyferredoxin